MDGSLSEGEPVLLSGVILAGGRSTRLGRNKAMVEIDGKSILQHTTDVLRQIADEIIIVIADLESKPSIPDETAVRLVSDLFPGAGSLGGLYTGISASKHFRSLVVACDMPFLNVLLLDFMRRHVANFDVLIPRLGAVLEPLHAIYSKNCLAPVAELLTHGNLKIIDFFPAVKVGYLDAEEIDRFDPSLLSFVNVNTPEDLARAYALATHRKQH